MIRFGYDYRTGLGKKDPDAYSKELKEDHIELLSRPFPNGVVLRYEIKDNKIVGYLNDEFFMDFKPDSFTNGFANSGRTIKNMVIAKEIVEKCCKNNHEIKKEVDEYYGKGYPIESSIVFPVTDDNGSIKNTINQRRGCSPYIQDRTDLTLECIRRYYEGNQDSPLKECLNNYSKFFSLFGSGHEGFVNYVKWFYLDDLVTDDYKAVKSFTSLLDFNNPFPITEEEYLKYIKAINKFLELRYKRIDC